MTAEGSAGLERARRRLEALFTGTVSPWVYAMLRVGLASIVLARTTVWDWLPMDHHRWVVGLEYHPAHDLAETPALRSPLWAFVPAIGPGPTAALTWVRTALAALLLVGIRPRAVAGLLALVGYGLVAADRYRYLHHLHLLWLTVALLALAPSGERLAPFRRWLGDDRRPADAVPRWPLQVMRFHLLLVYLMAGVAKLDSAWLSGHTLAQIADTGLIGGPLFEAAVAALGFQGLSLGVVVLELGLPCLLALPRARIFAVSLALAFHVAVEATMMVSTFGATMILLVLTFLPGWMEKSHLKDD